MIKNAIKKAASFAGLLPKGNPRYADVWRSELDIDDGLIDEIFVFFDRIGPFYDSSIPAPLQIGGAWRDDLVSRRKEQI
jgi:hypothetical protein